MNKITMNDNQRTSFHFNRHKIFLIISRGRPIKSHSIFTSNEPSHKTIYKQHENKTQEIKITLNLYKQKKLGGSTTYFYEIQE